MSTEPSEQNGSSGGERGQAATSEGAGPRCRCGYDRSHYMVSAECKYSGWGWFWVTLVGASATPVKAVFRCRRCREIIEETEDPEILKTLI